MKKYKINKKPTLTTILWSYLKKYGILISIAWLLIFIIDFDHGNFIKPLMLLITFLIFGYGYGYSNYKVVYQVDIDCVNSEIMIYSFMLFKSKLKIKYLDLHIEFIISNRNNNEIWEIDITKKPGLQGGKIFSSNGYWSWDKKVLLELSKELAKVKNENITWNSDKLMNPRTFEKRNSFKRVDSFE